MIVSHVNRTKFFHKKIPEKKVLTDKAYTSITKTYLIQKEQYHPLLKEIRTSWQYYTHLYSPKASPTL